MAGSVVGDGLLMVVGDGLLMLGSAGDDRVYVTAGDAAISLLLRSISAEMINRRFAENSGSHVVKVSIALFGSVVAVTQVSLGLTIC